MFKLKKLLLLVEIWWTKIHYLNEPCWTFRIRKTRIDNKRNFIDNRKNLCRHGGLHPMIVRKGKYIPGKVNNSIKYFFIKIGNLRVCWDLIQLKKYLISLTMTYERAIWHVIFLSKNCGITCNNNWAIEEITLSFEGIIRTWQKSQRRNIWSLQNNHSKIDRLLLQNSWLRNYIIWKRVFVYSTEGEFSIDICFRLMYIDW